MDPSNREIGEQFALMAKILELLEGNPFRTRAYSRAAGVISSYPAPLSSLQPGELEQIPGIGRDLAVKIKEILQTGTFRELDEARKEVPPGVLEMLELDGVGPKTARVFWKRLNISSVEELEKAARGHRLRSVQGFGEKKEAAVLEAVSRHLSRQERMTIPVAEGVAARVIAVLPEGSAYIAGSLRRGTPTVGDIDIVVTLPAGRVNPILREIASAMIEEGEKRTSFRIDNTRVDIRFTYTNELGSMLLYLTGSKAFNIRMREMAISRGKTLNEYGIIERDGSGVTHFSTEEDLFRFFRMSYIPPELREDRGEVPAALKGTLPNLLTQDQLQGDLHVHTDWSDGSMSLRSLSEAAAALGYRWVLCSDHAAGPGITHGMDASRLKQQMHEIEVVNRDSPCEILSGAEVDIRSGGDVALPSVLLGDLDIVIGSIHSGFHEEMDLLTRRMITAIENENVDIIGHPTGRLLLERPAYAIDIVRIIESAGDTGTALECNASPFRLDLDSEYLKEAASRDVKVSLGTDAHSSSEMASMRYGILTARRGWCTKESVLNTMSAKELREWAS